MMEKTAGGLNPVKIKLIPHDGGPCPVDGSAILKCRDGLLFVCTHPDYYVWSHSGQNDDIISYCPIEIEGGE